jgi:hypothetical protein
LSIAHLLLWITMTSVVLAIGQQMLRHGQLGEGIASDDSFSDIRAKWRVTTFVRIAASPAYGAALAGVTIALWRLCRGRQDFPAQPGHLLLIVIAAQQFSTVAVWLLQRFVPGYAFWMASLVLLVPAFAGAVAAIHSKERRWRLAFFLHSLGFVGYAIGIFAFAALIDFGVFPGISLLIRVPSLIVVTAYATGLAAAFWDVRLGIDRDFFHWVGVAALLAVTVETIATWIIWQTI